MTIFFAFIIFQAIKMRYFYTVLLRIITLLRYFIKSIFIVHPSAIGIGDGRRVPASHRRRAGPHVPYTCYLYIPTIFLIVQNIFQYVLPIMVYLVLLVHNTIYIYHFPSTSVRYKQFSSPDILYAYFPQKQV